LAVNLHVEIRTSSSAIAERLRCKVELVMAKSGRLELGDNILLTLWVYLQPLWRNWQGRYQSTAHLRLPISD